MNRCFAYLQGKYFGDYFVLGTGPSLVLRPLFLSLKA